MAKVDGRCWMLDAHDVGRAFSQHVELGRASCCGRIDMLYGGYRVVYEVKDAWQKPPWT